MFRLRALAALCVLAMGVQAIAENAAKKSVDIGDRVADFTFKDIRYLPRSLSDFGEKEAFVIAFTNRDCPLVQRYLPRLVEMEKEYRDRGVQFLSINVGPADPIVEVALQAVKAGAEFPFGKDFDGSSVQALGVQRTPEVCVLDGDHHLRYRGRIDSQYRLGGVSPNEGREDLKEAIEDVLAGRDVRVPTTTVDGCRITFESLRKLDYDVTYAEQVSRLFQKHCQECHRPGTTAPFSLLTYEDAVDHAEMIAEVVQERRMPPSFSSEENTQIVNRRNMSAEEIDEVLNWVASDTPEGDKSKSPEPLTFPEIRWHIGEPDLVITMSKEAKLPADGYVPYKYAFLPHRFTEDTWIEKIEVLPGNIESVHHCNVAAIVNGDTQDPHFITGYVPGGVPMVLNPHEAFRIPKGSVLVLQLHYITTGEEETDKTSVGLVFAKDRVDRELHHFQVTDYKFEIPAGAPHHPVVAQRKFDCNAIGVGMFAHMHLRGKDMTFTAKYPDDTDETLLNVPNYSFDWQMAYRWEPGQKRFPKGTVIEVQAHFDNSPFNPYNPAPEKNVKYGPQTYHEMMFGFFFYVDADEKLGLTIDPTTGHVVSADGKVAAGEQAGR